MSFEREILEAKQVALFLDFDGTLAPIVPRPADAAMSAATRQALETLSRDPKYIIAFVSGRSVEDLELKAAIAGSIYAGNHGLEIRGCGLAFSVPEDPLLRSTVARLKEELRPIENVEIEDKMLSASIHFRRVPPSEWPRIAEIVHSTVPTELTLRGGKMVFELRPALAWNKGSAVQWIIEQLHLKSACAVYIGDDLTDEDAFAILPHGLTIHVGSSLETAAKYRLRDTNYVEELLKGLASGS